MKFEIPEVKPKFPLPDQEMELRRIGQTIENRAEGDVTCCII